MSEGKLNITLKKKKLKLIFLFCLLLSHSTTSRSFVSLFMLPTQPQKPLTPSRKTLEQRERERKVPRFPYWFFQKSTIYLFRHDHVGIVSAVHRLSHRMLVHAVLGLRRTMFFFAIWILHFQVGIKKQRRRSWNFCQRKTWFLSNFRHSDAVRGRSWCYKDARGRCVLDKSIKIVISGLVKWFYDYLL